MLTRPSLDMEPPPMLSPSSSSSGMNMWALLLVRLRTRDESGCPIRMHLWKPRVARSAAGAGRAEGEAGSAARACTDRGSNPDDAMVCLVSNMRRASPVSAFMTMYW